MPNLIGQQTQTPFVFLSSLISIESILHLRLFFATFLSLSLTNLLIVGWSIRKAGLRLILFDVSMLGVSFLYTIHNDFFSQADQFWGLLLVIASFLNRELFKERREAAGSIPLLSVLSLLFGLGFFLSGHPSWFSFLIPTVLPFIFRKECRAFLKVRIWGLVSIACIAVLFPLITLYELITAEPISGDRQYSTQVSTWDLFSDAPHVFRFQPVLVLLAAAFQPLLRVVGDAGSRTEFFNFLLLAVPLSYLRFKQKKKEIEKLARFSTYVLALMILCLIFSGIIARADLFIVSNLFTAHGWQLAHPILLFNTLVAVIIVGEENLLGSFKDLSRWSLKILFSLGAFMGVCFSIVMVTLDVDGSKFAYFGDVSSTSMVETRLIKAERFADLSVSSNDSDYEWSALTGSRFELQLARGGYPTIEFYGAGRPSSTLVGQFEKYRSGYVPNTADCRPEVLEFLAVSSIFVNTEDTSGCREKLIAYFGEDSVREINKVAGPPGTASLFRPKSFSTWSIVTDSAENPSVSCPLLEQECLNGLEVTKLPLTGQAPFRLCEEDCLFTYKWAGAANTRQVLLPVNFDKTIDIKDSLTGKRLKTANYQGLLAVQVEGNESSGVFVGEIRPDLMMWLRVAMTYLHTIVFLGALGAMLVKGIQAVKEITRVLKASQLAKTSQ